MYTFYRTHEIVMFILAGYLHQIRSVSDESDYQEIDDVNEHFIRQCGRSRSMPSLDICDAEKVDWIRQNPNVKEYKVTIWLYTI